MDGRVLEMHRGDRVDFDVRELPLPATTKNTAGYRLAPGMDWVDLFTGSEGTLGVVTQAEMQLLPKPADVIAGIVFLISDGAAVDVVDAWRRVSGIALPPIGDV